MSLGPLRRTQAGHEALREAITCKYTALCTAFRNCWHCTAKQPAMPLGIVCLGRAHLLPEHWPLPAQGHVCTGQCMSCSAPGPLHQRYLSIKRMLTAARPLAATPHSGMQSPAPAWTPTASSMQCTGAPKAAGATPHMQCVRHTSRVPKRRPDPYVANIQYVFFLATLHAYIVSEKELKVWLLSLSCRKIDELHYLNRQIAQSLLKNSLQTCPYWYKPGPRRAESGRAGAQFWS